MPGPTNQFYRLRILNAAGTADQIVVTSVRGGTNPYLVGPPKGDGASFNPLTGEWMLGAYTIQIADWPTGGSPTQRILTSQLEDASSPPRQQLAYRRCVLEMGTDGATWPTVLIAGLLSLLKLVDAMTFEATIQDPMRAMDQSQLFSPASATTMASWFTQWPNRGCLAGGPLMTPAASGGVGPLGIRDLGGWQMRVDSLVSDSTGTYYVLHPYIVYGAPNWLANDKANLNDFADQINQAASTYQTATMNKTNTDPWTTIADCMTHGYCWYGITWLVDSGSGFTPWKPYPFEQFVIQDPDGQQHWNQSLISKGIGGNWGIGVMPIGGQALTPGTLVKVRALTVLPTDACPIYLNGHPCDLLTQITQPFPLLTWNAQSLSDIRNNPDVTGTDLVMTFRITAPMTITELVNQITQPLGLGIRGNDAGELELFDGRVGKNTTLPSVQIEASDVIDGTTSLPFELDPSLACKTITFTQTRFTDQRNAPFIKDGGIVDGVVVGSDTFTMFNGDTGALPYGQLDWKTDGMLTWKLGDANKWQQYVSTHAQTIFDRFGRGGIGFETTLLRGGAGDTLKLGAEALIHLPQVPNHNYRLGDNPAVAARRMQITRRTILPEGYAVRFDDSGANAQPLPIVPVLSIAVSPDSPRTVAIVTITNAATINGAGYGARVQWAVTNGAAPTAGQWTNVVAYAAGAVDSTIRLPPVLSGTVVWARGHCELAGNLASSWSAPVSVVLSGINAPTGLAVTPNPTDGSLETLTWTPGSGTTTDLTDIWLRTSTQAFGNATRIHVLNSGSVQYVIEKLTPGAGYIASVQHRDPTSGDVSAAVDIAFNAGGTQRTLSAPVYPAGFSGRVDPETGVANRDGTFGIAVLAAEFPGFLEVQIAIETGVGSGAYGGFVTRTVAPAIASIMGNWTKATFVAPNDGLRRQLQARHVFDGCVPSAYCAVVTVLPWTIQTLGPLPTTIIVEVTMLPPSPTTDAGVNLRFQIDAIDPYGQTTQVAVQSVQGTGVFLVSGPALGVLSPNDTVWVVKLPTPGSGPGTMVCRGQSADGRKMDVSISLTEQTTIANPQGTVAIDANGNWTASADGPANTVSFRWLSNTSGFPSDASVASSGSVVSGRSFNTTGTALAFGQTIFLTIIPFLGSFGSGTALPSIHIRGSFLQTTATKYDTYSGSSMVVSSQFTAVQQDANSGKLIAAAGSNPARPQASVGIKISNGVVINNVSMYCAFNYTIVAGKTQRLLVGVSTFSVSSNAQIPIAQPETDSPSSAPQLVTVTGLNHTVNTNTGMYQAACLLSDQANTATLLELWNFTLGYSQANANQGT